MYIRETPYKCDTCGIHFAQACHTRTHIRTLTVDKSHIYVVPAHQTSDMSRCTLSPESRLKLEIVILSNLRFLAFLTFQYVNYKFMCPDFNKH